MKNLFLFFLFIAFSGVSIANAQVFKTDSILPKTLQKKIISEVQKKCSRLDLNSFKEVTSTMKVERVDQGVVDTYYFSTFTAQFYFDGVHPILTFIELESQILPGESSQSEEVILIKNNDQACNDIKF